MTPKYRLGWSQEALEDLAQRLDFLGEHSPAAATRAGVTIVDAAEQLPHFPRSGRLYPRDPTHRELLIPFGRAGYSLLYRIEQETVLVVAIKHQLEATY